MDCAGAQCLADFFRAAAQPKPGSPAVLSENLNIEPGHTLGPAGSQRLEERLLGGEASRVVRSGITVGTAVRLLSGGEDAPDEAIALPLQGAAQAPDVDKGWLPTSVRAI